jgi:riboflavin synthase
VNGTCLTVVARAGNDLDFDMSAETLRCTTGAAAAGAVNLEKALRFGDRLGGHLVSGHVDGIGEVVASGPRAKVIGSTSPRRRPSRGSSRSRDRSPSTA